MIDSNREYPIDEAKEAASGAFQHLLNVHDHLINRTFDWPDVALNIQGVWNALAPFTQVQPPTRSPERTSVSPEWIWTLTARALEHIKDIAHLVTCLPSDPEKLREAKRMILRLLTGMAVDMRELLEAPNIRRHLPEDPPVSIFGDSTPIIS